MNREQLKKAADALGRLEALEKAWEEVGELPHGALPISFPARLAAGDVDLAAIRAYYPVDAYKEVLGELMFRENDALDQLGVERE